jgi:hypothetical protein
VIGSDLFAPQSVFASLSQACLRLSGNRFEVLLFIGNFVLPNNDYKVYKIFSDVALEVHS